MHVGEPSTGCRPIVRGCWRIELFAHKVFKIRQEGYLQWCGAHLHILLKRGGGIIVFKEGFFLGHFATDPLKQCASGALQHLTTSGLLLSPEAERCHLEFSCPLLADFQCLNSAWAPPGALAHEDRKQYADTGSHSRCNRETTGKQQMKGDRSKKM